MKSDEELYNEWKESSIDILGGSDYSIKAAFIYAIAKGREMEREACANIAYETITGDTTIGDNTAQFIGDSIRTQGG